MQKLKSLLLASVLCAPLAALHAAESPAQPPSAPQTQFLNDQPWPDDKGVHINAHGGGILFHEGVYYWFGEFYPNKKDPTPQVTGVSCYSSTDLLNWKNEGVVLARVQDPASEITEGSIIERPKVIYNAKTRKFVMWFHLELNRMGYKAARSGVAVADRPMGPYTYLHSERPDAGVWPNGATAADKAELPEIQKLQEEITAKPAPKPLPKIPVEKLFLRDFEGGQMARDMNLFVDEDGRAYHVFASEENCTLHISQLSDDYLSHAGKWDRFFVGRSNEAPALCKHDGRYWLIMSGCSGWSPNKARSAVADSIWGPWTEQPNPCTGGALPNFDPRHNPNVTFGGQSTCLLPINGKPGAVVAIFDIWRPQDQTTSSYIWLPVVFEKDHFTIPWRDTWDFSVFNR